MYVQGSTEGQGHMGVESSNGGVGADARALGRPKIPAVHRHQTGDQGKIGGLVRHNSYLGLTRHRRKGGEMDGNHNTQGLKEEIKKLIVPQGEKVTFSTRSRSERQTPDEKAWRGLGERVKNRAERKKKEESLIPPKTDGRQPGKV